MTETPTVSAVIPVYNGAAFLGEAIQSVLAQTLRPLECIVVDDGSTDATADVARSFGDAVTYLSYENAGVSAARNRGAAHASGDLLAFLDHDDTWLPMKLEQQVAHITETGASLVLCGMLVVDEIGEQVRELRLRPVEDVLTGLLMFDGSSTPSCSSTGLIRADAFAAVGAFDSALGTSADWDLLTRVLLRGKLGYVDELLVRYRVHGANMSRSVSATEHDMLHAYAKTFADAGLPDRLQVQRRTAYAALYKMLAGSYLAAGDLRSALRTGARSMAADPRIIVAAARHRLRAASIAER